MAESVAMDRAQREDLARRAAAKAEAEAAEVERQNASQLNFAGGLVAAGLAAAGLGLVLVTTANSAIADHKKELRQDAALEASLSVDGPMNCREVAVTSLTPDPGAAARCASSPRSYTNQWGSSPSTVGVLPVEFVLSSGFAANGEVTVHDKLNHRSLCVRIPDTDVMAAAHPETLTAPYHSTAELDVDPYIASGACPDAPVTTP